MRFISCEEFATAEFARAWKRLLRSRLVYDIGNTYEWNRCWWESYREQGPWKKHWFMLAHEKRGGEIDAIFPLIIRSRFGIRIVEFLGQSGGFMTDYLGSIGAPNDRDRMARQLLEFLAANADRWDLASLVLPAWGGELPWYLKTACLPALATTIRWNVEVPQFYVRAQLPRTFDAYLSSLGKKTRTHLRQYLRSAERIGATLDLYRASDATRHVDVLFRLNSQNWRVFGGDGSREFMTRAVQDLAAADESAILGVFRVNGEACGAFQGFEKGTTCFLHTAGVTRRRIAGLSPGTTMYALFIQSLIDRAFEVFNMGPGLEEYKLRLGGSPEPIYSLRLVHKRSRIARWRAFNWSRDAFYRARDLTRASFRSLRGRREDERPSRQT